MTGKGRSSKKEDSICEETGIIRWKSSGFFTDAVQKTNEILPAAEKI